MSSETSNFHVSPARDEDVGACTSIITDAFAAFSIERQLGNTNDAEGRKAAAQRHLRAWREHEEDTGLHPAVKCTHRDPHNGKETIIACGLWFIYPKPLSRNEERGADYLISGTWLPDDQTAKIKQIFRPAIEVREKWTAGRGYGLLLYMATAAKWRRKGAATACVEWGMERCREMGIPAYLEASKEGAPVYERLGFEIVDQVCQEIDGKKVEFPAMMWWPPGTRHAACISEI